MKNKIIFSIVLFILTFVISALFLTPLISKVNSSIFTTKTDINTQKKISSFLQADAENRLAKVRKLNNDNQNTTPVIFVSSINEYADKTEAMNLSGLPEDFQTAWLKYARATREASNFISNLKSLPKETILDKEEKETAEIKFALEKESWQNVISVVNEYGIDKYE